MRESQRHSFYQAVVVMTEALKQTLTTYSAWLEMREDDMIALLRFLGPEDHGRLRPPLPGYHPAVHILGEYTSCSLFPVTESVHTFEFNQEYEVVLRLTFPDHYAHQFHPGDPLEFYEGSKKVAQGILLSL